MSYPSIPGDLQSRAPSFDGPSQREIMIGRAEILRELIPMELRGFTQPILNTLMRHPGMMAHFSSKQIPVGYLTASEADKTQMFLQWFKETTTNGDWATTKARGDPDSKKWMPKV